MSDTNAGPVIAALAPALAYLAVIDSYQPGTSPEANEKFDQYTASIEQAARTLPGSLDDVSALIVAVLDILPWDNLVMDDGQTFNVKPATLAKCGGILHRALHNAAVILATHGAIPPLALSDYALEPTEAAVIRAQAERWAIREANEEAATAAKERETERQANAPTPEIEATFARWAKARGDMLAAYATDAPDDAAQEAADQAAGDASERQSRECWAMVGTPATEARHIRFKVEMFRDQYAPGSPRFDGLELALVNSIDTDLAALE